MNNVKMESLKPQTWYWSKALKKPVKFVEVWKTPRGSELYVEFSMDNFPFGGRACVPITDLYADSLDADTDTIYGAI